MTKGVTGLLLCLLALFVALGDVDNLLGSSLSIGPTHILAALFVLSHLLLNIKDVSCFFSVDAYLLLLLVIVLAVAQAGYGSTTYSMPMINYKLVVCSVFFLVLAQHFNTYPDHVSRVLSVFMFGCVVLGLAALFVPGVGETYKGQFIIIGENPNSTSSRMAVAFVIALSYLLHNPEGRKEKYIACVSLIVLMVIIVKSGSRGSLLAVLLSSVLLALLAPLRRRYKVILLLAMLLGMMVLAQKLLSLDGIAERWGSALQGDTAGRGRIWASAFDIFMDNPWIGVGEAGYFTEIYSKEYRFIDAHNLFVYVAVCGGMVGISILFIFLMRLFYKSYKALRIGAALPLVLLFNMLFIAAKTGGVLTYLLLWFIFAVVSVGQVKLADNAVYNKGGYRVGG